MAPAFSRKSSVLLILGVFALLFGFAGDASAATCQSFVGSSSWQKSDITCTLYFDDAGGSTLKECSYEIKSNGTSTKTGSFTPAEGCTGGGPFEPQITVSVAPTAGNCRDPGVDKCSLIVTAKDNSNNTTTTTHNYDIDYSPPSGGSISYADGFTALTSAALTVSDGTDADSGINIATRAVQRKQALLSEGVCGAYGSFTDISPSGTYPSFTNSGLVSGTCYQYRYLVSDNAGNPATYSSFSVVKVDTAKPDIHAFDVAPKIPAWVNASIANVAVSFEVSDTGGSGLKDVEVWRYDPDSATPPNNKIGWGKIGTVPASQLTPAQGSTTNYLGSYPDPAGNLHDGKTYRYGIHVNDNADNMRDDNDNTIPADPYTGGPLDVQVDKTAPTVSVGGVPADWQNSDATASVVCNDADCNATTYKLKTYTSSGTCSANYDDYTLSTPSAISSHIWVCAAAKDHAGNPGFSDADAGTVGLQRAEFKVDKTLPNITSFSPNRTTVNVANRTLDFSWIATDTGDAGLKEAVLWRKLSTEGSEKWASYGNPQAASWSSGSGTFSEIFPLGVEAAYNYGIHMRDKALNECHENMSPCGNTTQNKTPPDAQDQVYTRTIQVDTKAPSGSITIQSGNVYTTSTSVTLFLTCDLANDCKKMRFSNNGTDFTDPPDNFAFAKSWTLPTPDGTKTAYVQFQDNAGNWSSSFSDSIILDTQDPSVSFDSPDAGSWQTQDFTVQYDATDANINTCKLFTKDGAGSWIDRGAITCGSDKTKSIDIDLWCTTQGQGQCGVWIPASDLAGRTNQAGRSFSIDTIAPPKPTCSPAGGTFQNRVNNVTCSAESGAIIRYTLTQDGSSPDLFSTLYSAPFDITSTAILTVAAWDIAGNRSADNSYSFTIAHNQSPNITSNCNANPGCDSPDPIKANTQITFSVSWNDPDNDSVTFFACKNNVTPSGGDCSGGSTKRWCRNLTAVPPGTNATCSYTTAAADAGTKDYYAFVCDDENACSNSKSGTFLVDTQAPTVTTFVITPASPSWANPSIMVTWNVSDQGGSHLDRVRVYRAPFGTGCNDTTKASCVWAQAGSDAIAPNNSDNWNCGATCNDRIIDPPGSGTWWYGMHVLDKAQNETVEPTPPGPKKALVDTNEPNSQIQSPASSSWFSNDFTLDTLDEDLLSGLDTAQCQYKIIPYEDTNGDGMADTEGSSSGWLSRTCNAPPSAPVTAITVGPTDYCKYQAKSSCWVYIRSKDVAGNLHTPTQPAGSIRLYNVDWTQPQPGKLYITPNEGNQTYPIQVQLSRSDTYKVHVADNLKVSGCSLYIDGIDQGAMVPTVPGCETDCTFTKDFTFTGTGTYHNNYAQCKDAANNSKSGTSVDVEVKTLAVDLAAAPSSGSTHTIFDLVVTVSGTMTGDINYKFDCDTSQAPTWNLEVNGSAINPYTAADLCQYASTGTYTAKVFVQRGVGTAEDTVSIGPITTNSAPEAAITCDPASCVAYDSGILTLRNTSSDLDGAEDIVQSTWDILGFGSGSELTCPPGPALCNYTIQPMPAGDYTMQLSVKDSQGDTDSAQRSFTLKRDIAVNFECSLNGSVWQACSTVQPSQGEVVQVRDTSVPSEGASAITSWIWTFQDGIPASANTSIASTVFQSSGPKTVTLQVTDNDGRVRTGAKTINLAVPFPEWQEISPF